MKLLSLCIPTYNRADKLARLLGLVTSSAKLLRSMEIVIADNASSDNTEAVCRKFQNKFGNIVYVRNKKNEGPHVNIEIALSHATGKYAWLFGDDDIILVDHAEAVLKRLESETFDVYLVDRVIFYEDMKTVFSQLPFRALLGANFSGSMERALGLASPFFLFGCISVLILRRETLNLSCLRLFRNMHTLHTQVGMTAASNSGRSRIFIDTENYIISNISQRPEGYTEEEPEQNEAKPARTPFPRGESGTRPLEDRAKAILGTGGQTVLWRDLTFNMLRVYHFLIKRGLWSGRDFNGSSVYDHGGRRAVATPIFHFALALYHKRVLDSRQRRFVREFYKKYSSGLMRLFYAAVLRLALGKPRLKTKKKALFGGLFIR